MKQLVTFLLLLPLATLAQRIQSDQADDFGVARRIATSRVEFNGMGSSVSATANICEADTLLRMNIIFRAGQPTFTDERTTAVLHLNNGESISVAHIGNRKELTATEPGFLVFALTDAAKAKLTAYTVTGYTIHTGAATVAVNLNNHQGAAFRNTIQLLQDHARSIAALE